MAKDEKKELLFQAITNNEIELVKKLVEEDKVEFETLGEDVFSMSDNCSILGYVVDKTMMHYFLDKGNTPNIYDIVAISDGSEKESSKIDILDYYLSNFSETASQELYPEHMYDSLGGGYQVAKYINKENPLLTMMFFTSIRMANKNLYNYLKPKLSHIDLNSSIPIRYETYYEDVSEEKYYIIEEVTKKLSRKTADNELFMEEIENESKKGKQDAIDYVADENKKYLQWLDFLFDEGVSPFNSTLVSNFSYETYPFSILVLNRENNLVKKAIEKFPDDWDNFRNSVDLLDDILAYNKQSSNYFQRDKNPEIYIYPYRAALRDEIIEYLAKNGFPFYKSLSFIKALRGNVVYKNDYTKYDFEVNKELFWDILEKYTPKGDGTFSISSNDFTDEQNDILEKKGYALNKNEQLLNLLDSLEKYNDNEKEIIQKAQKLIDKGASFKDAMGILYKFSNYALSENYRYSNDYTSINKLIIDNDMVSKKNFNNFFNNEEIQTYNKEKIFEYYQYEKKALYDKYKESIFNLDFKLQSTYITKANLDENESYQFFVKNPDKFTLKYFDNGNLNTTGDSSPLYDFEYAKNWDSLRGYIKYLDEYTPLKPNCITLSDIKNLLRKNAPSDLLKWYEKYVNVDAVKTIEYELFENIVYNDLNLILEKFRDKPAILNVSNKYAKTLLHNACESKNLTKIKKLLDLGLSVNIQDKYNKTPFDSFLKAKPDVDDEVHFKMFETLLTRLLQEGAKPSADAIKPIKAKKYKAYHDVLNNYSYISDEIDKENEAEDAKQEAYDNELVEVRIYRTEVSTHYHRYATTAKIPRKDLVLDDADLVDDYYDYSSEEYDSDWDSSSENEWEIVK